MKKHFWDEGSARKIKIDDQEKPLLGLVKTLDDLENLYPPKEAAAKFPCEISTLYKYKCLGIIEATKLGHRIFFTAQQIADGRRRLQNKKWRK